MRKKLYHNTTNCIRNTKQLTLHQIEPSLILAAHKQHDYYSISREISVSYSKAQHNPLVSKENHVCVVPMSFSVVIARVVHFVDQIVMTRSIHSN
jgi:FMN-dependent NADH-azoreductase